MRESERALLCEEERQRPDSRGVETHVSHTVLSARQEAESQAQVGWDVNGWEASFEV